MNLASESNRHLGVDLRRAQSYSHSLGLFKDIHPPLLLQLIFVGGHQYGKVQYLGTSLVCFSFNIQIKLATLRETNIKVS